MQTFIHQVKDDRALFLFLVATTNGWNLKEKSVAIENGPDTKST